MQYKFITFEGVEGCGKSTQSKLLRDYLQEKNNEVILTREPGGTKVAEEIRAILVNGAVNKLDGVTEILLNFAARRDHVERLIKPALQENKIIISDRFFDSTYAYQGYGYGEDLNIIENIKQSSIGDFAPEITFLIDIDVEETLKRVANRSDNNRYEDMDLEFHQKVRHGFLEIAKNNHKRFRVIDGRNSIEEIQKEIREFLK
jgi:dTMP kinase